MSTASQSGKRLPWALLCALGGCADSGVSTSGDRDASGSELELAPGPTVLDTPEAVHPGGLLYVVVDAPISRIAVEIDGQPLGPPVDHPQGDLAAALFSVPDDLPLGPATLAVRTTDPLSEATELALELREAVFAEVGPLVGLDHQHDVSDSPIECAESHTGVAFGDFDGDGLPDVYVGNVGSEGKLYRNRGSSDAMGLPAFEEVTA